MKCFIRLRNTMDLITGSLLAQESSSGTTRDEPDPMNAPPRFLDRFAQKNSLPTTREQAALQHRVLAYFLPSTWPVAAPFILFRLKRTGYSNCRVVIREGGLLITATR